ncbi:hypothetical protein D9758_017360 [Tetrapyrgos nigripes]|uniref:Uncharacterized protein n=1 Tax=Tetrapyrgos nigripes TaxID=182062 RepID=A0A8H5FFP4_9AGAR|nr:hypothetical protein D9758_017360 [Tetrapyrgos nigripes]
MPLFPRGSSLRPNDCDPQRRKTHKNAATIALLEKLTLEERLKTNLEIENRNTLKRQTKLKKARGEDVADMSDTASLITIRDDEFETIRKSPDLYDRFKPFLPSCVIEWISKKNAEEKAADKDVPVEHSFAPTVQTIDCDSITPASFKYPPELFLAAKHGYIPLGLFHTSRIRLLASVGANHNTRHVYPDTTSKGIRVWDVIGMAKSFGFDDDDFEGCPTYNHFIDAMSNLTDFIEEWEKNNSNGPHSQFIFAHSAFWCKDHELIDFYHIWKKTEKALHLDWHNQNLGFDKHTYRDKLQQCRTRYAIDQLGTATSSSSSRGPGRDSRRDDRGDSSSRGSRHTRFPKSSARDADVCCLLCGERGHRISKHPKDSPTLWAKGNGKGMQHPSNGKSICISFNVLGLRGGRGPNQRGCSGDCGNLHICSYCGKDDHHAFSGKCGGGQRPSK